MKRIVLSLTIIAALSAPVIQAKEKLKILSTIKPIHSLVSAIAGDLAETEQIIPNYGSPHHYSLKPSDLRKINSADLIFRVDPNLESFLQKSLRSLAEGKVVSLSQSVGMSLLAASGKHEDEDIEDKEEHSEHNEHSEGAHIYERREDEIALETLDYHLWLSPNNAIAMADNIRDQLTKIAPKHSEKFASNTKQLIDQIHKTDKSIKQQLNYVKAAPFLVMHDAWQYFTKYYQLNQLGSISAQERLKSSAKAISEARSTITESKVRCLVAEPNLKTKTLRILIEDLPVNITQIDPLGREIPESNLAYPELLQYTADKLLNCLKKK